MLTLATFALLSALQTSGSCLHDRASETPEQVNRRHAALALARTVNTAESRYAAQHGRKFADAHTLATTGDLPADTSNAAPGFELRLDVTDGGYWFEIADRQDTCGFRYIGNQNGLIFEARPIR